MFAKLLKHEFIATGRIMGVLYAVVLLIMGYILGSYYFGRDASSAVTTTQMLGVMLLMIISMCNFILTTVVMVTNFQKSLYGDQGYLSFTLPVKSVSLLASKVVVSTVWYILAYVCLFATIALNAYVFKEDVIGQDSYAIIESFLPMLLGGKSLSTIITTIVVFLVIIFLLLLLVSNAIYFAISLANTRLFQKKYTLWTVIFSIVIGAFIMKLSEIVSNNVDFGLSVVGNSLELVTSRTQVGMGGNFINLTFIVIFLVMSVALFFATHYVMNKKVNIR